MARATMATLITRLRLQVHDAAGTAQVFTDDELQELLDARRVDIYDEPMLSIPQVGAGGTVNYYEFGVPGYGDLEDTLGGTAVFYVTDSVGARRGTAMWADVDYQRGRVVFTTDQAGTALYVTARSYDVNGAAADACERWAQRVALQFDFSTDGQSFSRSQQLKALNTMATQFRSKARIRRTTITRTDVKSDAGPTMQADEVER